MCGQEAQKKFDASGRDHDLRQASGQLIFLSQICPSDATASTNRDLVGAAACF
jgi:hypothetical protein